MTPKLATNATDTKAAATDYYAPAADLDANSAPAYPTGAPGASVAVGCAAR